MQWFTPRLGAIASAALVLCLASASAGQTEPNGLEQAKELFRRGVTLLGAGDTERALELFLRSRDLVPSGKNTVNAAICLERLGRYDEALELYEEVVVRFADDLDPQDRSNLAPVMQSLRARIGYLDLSANVEGLVTIAGRPRGRLPLRTPLRVLPGARTLRITQDGYRSFETELAIVAGETQRLDAHLEPLSGRGARRVAPDAEAQRPPPPNGRTLGKTPSNLRSAGGPRMTPWKLDVGLRAGALYAPLSHAGLESSCPGLCAGTRNLWGAQAALTFGAQHANGWGAEIAAGYAAFGQRLNRAVLDRFSVNGDSTKVTYALEQTLLGRGPFSVLQGRFQAPIGAGLSFWSRAGGGLWLGRFETAVRGQAWTTGAAEPLRARSTPAVTEAAPLIALSLGLSRRVGRLTLSFELGVWYLPLPGPALGGPTLGASGDCELSRPSSVGCSPNSGRLERERAHGSFFMVAPQLGSRYTF